MPGMREAFLNAIAAEGLDAACRAEAGNLKYDYYLPAAGGDELLLVERWRDDGALAAHMKQPHFKRLGELKAAYTLDTTIEQYAFQE
jgi:quinol monooxygenase YgiN